MFVLHRPELRKPVQKVATLIREVLPWQKLVSAMAKPLGSMLLLSRRVFSAQDGARQKLEKCLELPGNKLSKPVFKNSARCL
jgi:hypothetical protein